jgi:hypothetical protein
MEAFLFSMHGFLGDASHCHPAYGKGERAQKGTGLEVVHVMSIYIHLEKTWSQGHTQQHERMAGYS